MTKLQKEQISYMRQKGDSYTEIAEQLSLSRNTVKSYCQRNNLGDVGFIVSDQSISSHCQQCSISIKHITGAKQKRFCSDKCRMSWWNAHPEAVKRKAIYSFTCTHCGIPFESYGNKNRKYCSRACYGKSKAVCNE